MGYGPEDKLSIISLNSQRRGLQTMSGTDRPSYYKALFEQFQPDICFMPGDDKRAKLNALVGYGQYLLPDNDDTVLLYDAKKVEMRKPDERLLLSISGELRHIDLQEMVVPTVKIWTPAPAQRVVKEFNLVSWKFDYFKRYDNDNLTTAVKSMIEFSQRLCHETQKPILIGGEMNLIYTQLEDIVKRLNQNGERLFLSENEDGMSQLGLTGSIANTASLEQRHIFMMNVIQCKAGGFNDNVKKQLYQSSENVADCFIASKQLKLDDASLIDIESVIGRKVNVSVTQEHRPSTCQRQETPMHTYRPTRTCMDLPPRPPKHYGG